MCVNIFFLNLNQEIMNKLNNTQTPPQSSYTNQNKSVPDLFTPPMQKSLCDELKKALNERNLLTVKSREKGKSINI